MIDINLHNYEEYFIDYFDGNLTPSEKNELMSFINMHPELREEFESFEQTALVPNEVYFKDKEFLKKQSTLLKNTDSNFDELCIAKLEGDLPSKEEIFFKDLLKDESKEKQFQLFSYTRLNADLSVVFDRKPSLKKSTIKKPVVKWLYTAISAAASVIILFGLYFYLQNVVHEEVKLANEVITKPLENKTLKSTSNLESKEAIAKLDKETISVRNTKVKKELIKVKDESFSETAQTDNSGSRESFTILEPKPITFDVKKEEISLLAVQTYQIEMVDMQDEEGVSLKSYLLTNVNKRLFKKDKETIELFDIAQASIEGINKIAGTKMSLERVYDANGKPNSTQFNSKLIAFSAPVKK